MTHEEILEDISEWANSSHSYLSDCSPYSQGYKDGITRAKEIVLEYLARISQSESQQENR